MRRQDRDAGEERRRHQRFPMMKGLNAKTGRGRYPGRLKDISAGGAGVYLVESLDAGEDITLEIDDLGTHAGHVVGPTRYDLIPIAFDNDEEEQDELIAEIMKCQGDMISEEDG
jgi:c-di-GMP-binding flagellar brake protein YcgR